MIDLTIEKIRTDYELLRRTRKIQKQFDLSFEEAANTLISYIDFSKNKKLKFTEKKVKKINKPKFIKKIVKDENGNITGVVKIYTDTNTTYSKENQQKIDDLIDRINKRLI